MLEPMIEVSFYIICKSRHGRLSLRIDECLVDSLSFVITSVLLTRLLFKSLPLVEGIVQLGVSICQFLGSALKEITQ
jgi:hypothetical protein